MDWKQNFQKPTLEKGLSLMLANKVVNLRKTDTGYAADVLLPKGRVEVSVKIVENEVQRLSCKCPVAKIGRNCEHMAALLYGIEAMQAQEKGVEALEALLRDWKKDELAEEEQKKRKAKAEQERKEAAEREERERKEREAREERERQEAERQKRRAERNREREQRKAERVRKSEEQKKIAEEQARAEYEKHQAEEARREQIRREKTEAAKRRQEKEQREDEEQKMRKKLQEEMAAAATEPVNSEPVKVEPESVEEEYTVLGGVTEETEADMYPDVEKGIQELENYRYFNGWRIRNSVTASTSVEHNGQKIWKEKRVQIKNIVNGYTGNSDEQVCQMELIVQDKGHEYNLRLIFEQNRISFFSCDCPKCRQNFWEQYDSSKTACPYKISALYLMEDYLKTHNVGDSTDMRGKKFLDAFERKRASRILTKNDEHKEKLQLIPRLTKKDGELSVSFKIGENKLYVVKRLDEFCRNVRHSAMGTYGTNTEFHHDIDNFNEPAKGWIHFLNRIVREENEFQRRLIENRNYYGQVKSSIGGSLELFGWRLDEFYNQLGEDSIEYEDKDSREKKKAVLTCADGTPKLQIQISEAKADRVIDFHGIKVEGFLPELYYGTDTAYYIEEKHLNRLEKEYKKKLEPLTAISENGHFLLNIGRNSMSEFYNRILPELQEIADVKETDPQKFRSYILPEPHFIFSLDAEEKDVFCRISAMYGEKEYQILENVDKKIELFRDFSMENEVLFQTMQWLPVLDEKRRELCCEGDEEKIYQLMKNGTEKLMELGEVRCTKRFLGFHTVNRVKVSVGVSVSSGLLELDIATEDVSAEELLDILKSYRTRKKYYRLKNGAFVDLEEPSLEMLSELTEAMNLKDKELLKGKMKLPMFRTLYLDKLLEENDSVYTSRDSHFREVVKEFKTVKDADFEEPKSLSKLMRKYQKDGYKWLRTLETWQFGGILADDMGLGKTLQVIAVLLAAKEEGKQGQSLVVTPASLVYNWGAEFERFAPALNVVLVTGNQEERQQKIENSQEADVLVTSYDLLKRDIALYEDREFNYQVIDEAQYIKNHTTAAAKAVKVIKSKTRYALTGTPIENRLSELWSIFDYLMPGFLYGYDVFKREIETPIVKSEDEKAMKRLQKMVGPFIMRRLKEDVLKDLPEKLEEHRYVQLGESQQKIYDAQVVHMKESIGRQSTDDFNKNKLQILAELTRLRQICCDPSLCFENYIGETAKKEACLDLIQSAMDGGHRILVFSQFTSMLEILQQELDKQGISYYTITGSTSKEKRLELVKSFNEGDTPVFLISLKAGGVGLNLTGADVVIHYDPWWNLAAQNQATDRAHRIGQTKKVTVYKLIARHTIEEKIQKLQETKKDLADQVMSGETGGLGSMSREEIMELLEV